MTGFSRANFPNPEGNGSIASWEPALDFFPQPRDICPAPFNTLPANKECGVGSLAFSCLFKQGTSKEDLG